MLDFIVYQWNYQTVATPPPNERQDMTSTTATHTDYPFVVNGVKFISRLDTTSSLYKQISALPSIVFETMNRDAVEHMIGDPSLLTAEQLDAELARVNAGASYAFILLDTNTNDQPWRN